MHGDLELRAAGFSDLELMVPGGGLRWRAVEDSQRVLIGVVSELRRGDALRVSEQLSLLRALSSPHIAAAARLISIGSAAVVVCEDPGGRALCGGDEPLRVRVAWLRQMAEGLRLLHGLELRHGQLRPSSWSVAEGACVLVDLAPVFGPVDHTASEELRFYEAPELRLSGRTAAADVYALGAVAFELLCGRRPFRSLDPLRLQHEHESIMPEPDAALPETLRQLLEQMLSKNPEHRPPLSMVIEALSQDEGSTEAFLSVRAALSRELLVGRAEERSLLLGALEAAARGQVVLVEVLGSSGVGKTALLRTLRPAVQAGGGLLGLGRGGGGAPLKGIREALEEISGGLLAGEPARLARARQRCAEELASVGAALSGLTPALDHLLLPPQPSRPEERATLISARQRAACVGLVRALADASGLLVLCIADADRADTDTLDILQRLLQAGDVGTPLLVVLSGKARCGALSEVAAERRVLELGGLDQAAVESLLQHTLVPAPADLPDLARLLQGLSAGNPLALRALLYQAESDDMLRFSPGVGRWVADLEGLQELPISGDVAALLQAQVAALPAESQQLLVAAGCCGERFDLPSLALALGCSEPEARLRIEQAVGHGLVTPVDAPAGRWGFLHRTIHQAVQGLSPEAQDRIHLRLGRALLAGEHTAEQLFAVLGHLNRPGLPLRPEEHTQLAALNLSAARIALTSGGFESALELSRAGLRHLAEQGSALRISLLLEGARAALGLGDGERVQALAGAVMVEGDPLEAARAAAVLIDMHTGQAASTAALSVTRAALARLGVKMPEQPGIGVSLAALLRARWAVRQFSPSRPLPLLSDPHTEQILNLMLMSTTPAYLSDQSLWGWLAAEMTRRGIRAGASAGTGWGLMNFAVLMGAALGELERGHALSVAGREMVERCGAAGLRSRLLSAQHATMHHIKYPLRQTLLPLRSGLRVGREEGDPLHAGIDSIFYINHMLFTGEALELVVEESERLIPECRRLGAPLAEHLIAAMGEAARVLQGVIPLDGWLTNAPEVPEEIPERDRSYFELVGRLLRVVAAVFAGRDDEALRQVALAASVRRSATGIINGLMLTFYGAVAAGRAALSGGRGGGRGLRAGLKVMRQRAALNPTDYAPRVALLEALEAAGSGRGEAALRAFDQALEGARAAGAVHEVILTAESRAVWLEGLGASGASEESRRIAQRARARWGGRASEGHDTRPPERSLDIAALSRAQQVLSAAGSRDAILRSLLQLVGQRAGAERSMLIEMKGERPVSMVVLSRGEVALSEVAPAHDISRAALRYVSRTGAALILRDAAREGLLRLEPEILSRGVRSLLCLPLLMQGERRGMLYLEHCQRPGVFTPERVEVVRVLAAMAGAMAENARLFSELEGRADLLRAANTRLEAHSRELEDAVEARTAELESLHAQLLYAQKMESIGQFVGGVAHEFNNLLMPILGTLELLQLQHEFSPEVTRSFQIITRAGERAATLVQQLLAFGRRTPLSRAPTDITALVEDVLAFARRSIGRDIVLRWQPPQAPMVALVDPGQIHQVLLNLLLNARDAILASAPPDPLIEVTLSEAPPPEAPEHTRWVTLTVRDNGAGMTEAVREKALEPFFTTKPIGKGTGLGLSVVVGIIGQHGGLFQLRPGREGGLAVCCHLPATQRPLDRPPPPDPLLSEATIRAEVLIVDDEPGVREVMAQLLSRVGHTVRIACDGAAALEAVEEAVPGLILLDLSMPGMDGWAVLRRLQERWPELPVIICSGHHAHEGPAKAAEAGAVGYIRKPFRARALIDTVEAALSAAR